VTAPSPDLLSADLGPVHFVGIGGAGMSGIARIMLARGVAVSGSDAKDSRELAALRALGADVSVGHDASHLGSARTVVVSAAIRPTNVEVVEAQGRDLRVLHRAEALAALMVGHRSVAVAGTHGKTTTTSMLTVALQHCGVDPSFAIGGHLSDSGANAHHGSGDVFVAEADESDGSFLHYRPDVAVVTNVDPDHLDHYGDAASYRAAFVDFAGCLAPGGHLVTCADDRGALGLAADVRAGGGDVRTYGESPDADLRIVDLVLKGTGARFDAVLRGRRLGPVQLAVPGRHNALDAAAALLAGIGLGLPDERLRDGLGGFVGTRRRLEAKGTAAGVRVIDSYAHHPTELVADLTAARGIVGQGRLVVAFQPHLYSRTRVFADAFGAALGLADEVVVMEVYAAREDPEPGVTGALVAAAVPLPPDQVLFEPSWSAVAPELVARARSGDVVMTLGAGDVTMLGPEVLALLTERQSGEGTA
jgi:UDP-N-acetylmuramate--alanine ligase